MATHRTISMPLILVIGVLFLLIIASSHGANSQELRFPDARDEPIRGWIGESFKLSQDYPKSPPVVTKLPWSEIDPTVEPNRYIRTVLEYAVEGNEQVDWRGDQNSIRKWFHAPWLHWGRNGREFIHGLTHERVSLPGELSASQQRSVQNWAVGLYNPSGGYIIGRVWKDPNSPNPSEAVFPDGTVTIKLLFSEATESDAPFLRNAKEWEAYIYDSVNVPTNPNAPRSIRKLRLLQIDVAIKESRVSASGGWVFGTFVYNGFLPSVRLWDRFIAVGVAWGNDPDITVSAVRRGAVLTQSWINPDRGVPFQHLGWAGRLNGPVDNPISSCLSCHSTAQWPPGPGLVPPRNLAFDSPEFMRWFRNIRSPTETFSPGAISLDYSLQLMAGIANYNEWKRIVESKGGNTTARAMPLSVGGDQERILRNYFGITRGGQDE